MQDHGDIIAVKKKDKVNEQSDQLHRREYLHSYIARNCRVGETRC